MENRSPLFAEFSAITTEEWIAKIRKDLKGKALETLNWEPEPGLQIPPLYHATDTKVSTAIEDPRQHNSWEIGQVIRVRDLSSANTALLNNLRGGVTTIHLQLSEFLSEAQLHQLLKDVVPTYISLHFSWEDPQFPVQAFWLQLKAYLEKHNEDPASWRGALLWQAEPEGEALNLAAALIKSTAFTTFQCLHIAPPEQAKSSSSAQELADLLTRGQAYLGKLQEQGIEPSQCADRLQFSLTIGSTFFLEIAKLRALKLLWTHVLKAYQVAPREDYISAYTAAPVAGEDPYRFMIQSATQAMSAVMGGAHRLFVSPADQGIESAERRFIQNRDFGARIARNVQHLLQMESFLDRVIDPGAGSYYIENLTQQLATQAWVLFQEQAY